MGHYDDEQQDTSGRTPHSVLLFFFIGHFLLFKERDILYRAYSSVL